MTQYTVKSGDTLSAIANKYGVDVGSISGYSSGNPNLIYPGEVLTLSNVGNSVSADNMQPSVDLGLPSEASQQASGTSSLFGGESINDQVDKYRKQLEDKITSRKSEIDAEIERLRGKEEDILGDIEDVTSPFREDLENTERERLYINENFEQNQQLINELDTLLTQGNDLIQQQQEITGLAAVRNPRIQKTMDDVAARAGVIEAVINARNGQIAVAENLIDRSISAIAQDRQDQLAYYSTILELNRDDILDLDEESEQLATAQLNLIENDLTRAQDTADYIKKLMVNPDSAMLMGEAGVSLNDSVEDINIKMTQAQHARELREASNAITSQGGQYVADPSGIPADQLVSITDANGNVHHYKMPKSTSGADAVIGGSDPRVSAWVSLINRGNYELEDVPSDLKTSVAIALGQSGGSLGITFEQFLAAAQDEAGMSFGPGLIGELRTTYDSLSGSSSGLDNIPMDKWKTAIEQGYATKSDIPEDKYAEIINSLED